MTGWMVLGPGRYLIMFAVAALLCFVLALFHAPVGLNLQLLGLAFLAAHLVFTIPVLPPWGRRQQ